MSGARAIKAGASGNGATVGSSRVGDRSTVAGTGEGRAASSAAASPSHSPNSVAALSPRRWTRGRGIIAGPSLRVVGLTRASTSPGGASALIW